MDAINLQKYSSNDFSTYFSLVKEDSVMRYVSGHGLTMLQAKEKFDTILAINTKNPIIGYFKIINIENEFIGDAKLEWNKEDDTLLEIGYILKEIYWGKGYGTLICKKLLNLADQLFPHVDIIGIIDPENIPSRKLLEKNGFKSYFIGMENNLPTEKLMLNKSV